MSNRLEHVIQWAQKEDSIKTILLVGSRVASKKAVDRFSDYDLSIFCTHHTLYTDSTEWLSHFGSPLVCVKETILCCEKTFPSRLVIFESGTKMDFSFLSMSVLEELTHSHPLPDPYNGGYQVLLDKEQTLKLIPQPQRACSITKPTEQAFHQVIEEFWFEVYHIAVYLKREDLWQVKERSHAAQTFLLKMIEWHAQVENGWASSPPPLGKRMPSWVNQDLWKHLHGVFAHFNTEDSWKALFTMMELFQTLTANTAQALRFSRLEKLSSKMTHFITALI